MKKGLFLVVCALVCLTACSPGSVATVPRPGPMAALAKEATLKLLHAFSGKGDGSSPGAALTEMNGVLYGTTEGGGAYGDGTVFSITPGGSETVIHSSNAKAGDGGYPSAP